MRFEPSRPKNDEERILPLINVVFLLLIFFMLAGKLSADVLDLPAFKASLAGRLAAQGKVRVRLKADGRAEATRVVAVMELLREAGVKRLKLLTLPAEGR